MISFSEPITTLPVTIHIEKKIEKQDFSNILNSIPKDSPTIWEIIKEIPKLSKIFITVIYYIIRLLLIIQKAEKMNSDKITTILGLISGIIVSIAGWMLPEYVQNIDATLKLLMPWIAQTIGVIITLLGYWAKKK
jgi:surface polysaccharide O-acyltransferase-like enzyme